MASATSLVSPLPTPITHRRVQNSLAGAPAQATVAPTPFTGRRDCLLLLTATALTAIQSPPAVAEDIPLFGLRKKIEKAEKQAVELVKEGFETAEKGIETAEKGIVTAEKGFKAAEERIEAAEKVAIETAETGIETAAESINFSGLAQAGVVAGAEFLGILVATSIVNGILGPDPQNS